MAKRVQLVLNQDVSKLGKSGDLVEVAPGYARNYLIPQKLGIPATAGLLKQVERRREKERLRLLEEKQQSLELKTAIEAVGSYTIAKQVGEENDIFGTVTSAEVVTAILQATGKEIDRRTISLPDIGETGTYKAEIKLHPEVSAVVQIQVVPS